jgi:hypothetical protein
VAYAEWQLSASFLSTEQDVPSGCAALSMFLVRCSIVGCGHDPRAEWSWWTARIAGVLLVWSWWTSRGLLRKR